MERFQVQHLLKKNLLSGRVRKKSCQWNELSTVEERSFNEICAHYLFQISLKKQTTYTMDDDALYVTTDADWAGDVDHRRSTADKNFFYRSQGQQSAVALKGKNRKLENFCITLLQIGNLPTHVTQVNGNRSNYFSVFELTMKNRTATICRIYWSKNSNQATNCSTRQLVASSVDILRIS